MNMLRPVLRWLWERPTYRKYRLLAPRIFWYLLIFAVFVLFGYVTTDPLAPPADKERFRSFYHNGWTSITAMLFICSWILHDYLSKSHSSPSSSFSNSNGRGINYKDPLATCMVVFGLSSIVTLTIAFFQTWAKP